MLGNPLLHLDGKPETVNTKGNDGKQEPLNEVTEKLSAGTVKSQSVTVDNGVLYQPSLFETYCPRSTDTQCEGNDKALENTDTDHTEKTACEFGFHIFALLLEN